MIVKTLEIGWHEAKPIYSCDFQRRSTRTPQGTVAHKFATAGADTHVRIWLIHPTDPTATTQGERSPRAEYLSTLTKHSGAVNVVRWSPNGELLASGADDGMLIIWTRDDKPQGSVWGRDPKEAALDKETWRVLNAIRVTSGEVYDIAWSPTGEYILTGSTDNTARIFSIADNVCVREIADHNHYVQGVSWDPMNEYIATQSSDRSVKLYSISTKGGTLETHPVGSNSKMVLKGSRRHQRTGSAASMKGVNSHSRAPSVTRPSPAPTGMGGDNGKGRRSHVRRSSISSEASSVSMAPSTRGDFRESVSMGGNSNMGGGMDAPLTPATSTTSGVGGMFLPPSSSSYSSTGIKESGNSSTNQAPMRDLGRDKENPTPFKEYREPRTAATSRRSSFSGSQAPGSPASFRGRGIIDDRDSRSTYGRSPSPMPPLPAIRTPHPSTGAPAAAWAQAPLTPSINTSNTSNWLTTRLYGDENVTSFFRRLTFSPDGNLLFTPAGWFEDNSVNVHGQTGAKDEDLFDVEKEKEKEGKKEAEATSSSCVYVYSKANFSKSPIAAYPGHKRAVVCVKFSNILYDLRPGVTSSVPPTPSSMTGPAAAFGGPITVSLEPGKEDVVDMGLNTPVRGSTVSMVMPRSDVALPSPASSTVDLITPSQTPKKSAADTLSMMTGAISDAARGEGSGATASVFTLPYRMMFAVATQDTVAIHDTQQAGPICLLSKLHYDSFTDMAWSGDGNVLMLVSSDGYCTVVVFDEHMSHYQTQQRDLQLRSVALAHSHSLIATTAPHPSSSHPSQHHPSFSSSYSMSTGAQSPLVHPSPSPFIPPHAPSPAVSLKELPGPSGVVPLASAVPSTSSSSGVKRPASSFDPPLTPAASVTGGDVDLAKGATAGMLIEGERDAVEEGPAKKRRRVELKHHGAM